MNVYDSPRPCDICGKVNTNLKIYKNLSNIIIYKCKNCSKESIEKKFQLRKKPSVAELYMPSI